MNRGGMRAMVALVATVGQDGDDMSAPNKQTGKAPRQRSRLSRQRRKLLIELRTPVFARLTRMSEEEGESMVAVIERLILEAAPAQMTCA
jgi:hypothetical protein